MAVASAFLAGSAGEGSGPIGSCWRQRSMQTTALSRLLSTMTTCLEIIQSHLETSNYSSNDSEKRSLTKFGISLAANMVRNLDDLIIMLPSLDTKAAYAAERLLCEMANAVEVATRSWTPGDRAELMSLLSVKQQPLISPVTSQKSGHARSQQNTATRNSRECP